MENVEILFIRVNPRLISFLSDPSHPCHLRPSFRAVSCGFVDPFSFAALQGSRLKAE